MAKKRPPKYCEECGKKLRSNYRPKEVVCSKPKVNGTSYSKCQKDRLVRLGRYSVSKDTTGRKCKICDKVMEYKSNANQIVCKHPIDVRKQLKEQGKEYRTDCEKKNQENNGRIWNKDNRKTKKQIREEREFFIGKEELDMLDYAPLKEPPVDNKKRRCLGVLSRENELGEHFFISKGPYNRICDECVEAAERRQISHYKDSSEGYTVTINRKASKKEAE